MNDQLNASFIRLKESLEGFCFQGGEEFPEIQEHLIGSIEILIMGIDSLKETGEVSRSVMKAHNAFMDNIGKTNDRKH